MGLEYSRIKGDGIYFQSFTELETDVIGDRLIAEAVTDFVNMTAGELLEEYPQLHIQFGLHAMSVKEYIEYLAKVDKRVEIVWEDCGAFPYDYKVDDVNNFNETLLFTEDIVKLRENAPLGLVYKGQLTMDWTCFAHQSGPYIMGNESEELIKYDTEMMKSMWHIIQGEWLRRGKYAYELTQKVVKMTKGNVNLCIAGTLPGKIWYPYALCAQILWDCSQEYEDIAEKTAKRNCVTMA